MKKLFKGLLCVAVICGLMTGCKTDSAADRKFEQKGKMAEW